MLRGLCTNSSPKTDRHLQFLKSPLILNDFYRFKPTSDPELVSLPTFATQIALKIEFRPSVKQAPFKRSESKP
jgi:hypothetical protein